MIVAVINKIVRDLDELIKWNGEVVAPANTLRLKKNALHKDVKMLWL